MSAPILTPTSAGVIQLAAAYRLRVNLAFDPSVANQSTENWADMFGVVNLNPGTPQWDKIDATTYDNVDPVTGLVRKRDRKVASTRDISGVWQRERFANPAENAASDRLKECAKLNKLAQVMLFNAVDRSEKAEVFNVDVTWDKQGGAPADKGTDNFTLSVQATLPEQNNPMGASVIPDATAVDKASAAAGTMVTITGTGLAGTTSVKFGTTNAAMFMVDSDGQVRAVVAGTSGSKPITLASPAGADSTPVAFTIS